MPDGEISTHSIGSGHQAHYAAEPSVCTPPVAHADGAPHQVLPLDSGANSCTQSQLRSIQAAIYVKGHARLIMDSCLGDGIHVTVHCNPSE